MTLHEDTQLFADAIEAAARPKDEGGLGIKSIFIEKDYWICRSLSLMAEGDKDNRAVFKGGTSLTKAYGIGARFSEDIDVAISEAWTLSGNQLKNLIRRTAKNMTAGLEELVIPGQTSKGSHYHKAFYVYPKAVDASQAGAIKAGQLLVEINSFANPYPFERRTLTCFLADFLQASGNGQLAEEYGLLPFEVNVLDKRRTLTEKLVSLLRWPTCTCRNWRRKSTISMTCTICCTTGSVVITCTALPSPMTSSRCSTMTGRASTSRKAGWGGISGNHR